MTADSTRHVIVDTRNARAYACTLDNARSLLARYLENLDDETREVHALLTSTPPRARIFTASLMRMALEEVASPKADGSCERLRLVVHGAPPNARSGLADTRPQLEVTPTMRQELALWLFERKLDPGLPAQLIERRMQELAPHATLSFLAPLVQRTAGQEVRYVSSAALKVARELKELQDAKWPSDASEPAIVGRYLEFISRYLYEGLDVYSYEPTVARLSA